MYFSSMNDAIISIHAPREGGDESTTDPLPILLYFNPRPPRGGRLHPRIGKTHPVRISIHAPREGGDASGWVSVGLYADFNPRPPRGGRPKISL